MDLSTTYLGLTLAHPFIAGASPLSDHLDTVRQLEDGGASAIVLHSLFEEQIDAEENAWHSAVEGPADTFAEATSYFPRADEYQLGPDKYLEQVLRNQMSFDAMNSRSGVARRATRATSSGFDSTVLRWTRLLPTSPMKALPRYSAGQASPV